MKLRGAFGVLYLVPVRGRFTWPIRPLRLRAALRTSKTVVLVVFLSLKAKVQGLAEVVRDHELPHGIPGLVDT